VGRSGKAVSRHSEAAPVVDSPEAAAPVVDSPEAAAPVVDSPEAAAPVAVAEVEGVVAEGVVDVVDVVDAVVAEGVDAVEDEAAMAEAAAATGGVAVVRMMPTSRRRRHVRRVLRRPPKKRWSAPRAKSRKSVLSSGNRLATPTLVGILCGVCVCVCVAVVFSGFEHLLGARGSPLLSALARLWCRCDAH
jgi:hypothetical protein